MKAKRLTALALAALMAVSSATVALADTSKTVKLDKGDGELTFGSNTDLYKYDDDEGTLVRVPDNAFQPGDTIYIPLYESTTEKLERGDTFYVHSDFDIGEKWVDDVRFEYRKGAVESNTTYNYSYTFNGKAYSGKGMTSQDTEAVRKNIRTEASDSVSAWKEKYKDETYDQARGYAIGEKFYASADEAAKAAGLATTKTTYKVKGTDGIETEGTIEELTLVAVPDSGYICNGTYYNVANAVEMLKALANSNPTTEAVYVDKIGENYGTVDSSGEYEEGETGQSVSYLTINGTKYWWNSDAGAEGLLKHLGVQKASAENGQYYCNKEGSALGKIAEVVKTENSWVGGATAEKALENKNYTSGNYTVKANQANANGVDWYTSTEVDNDTENALTAAINGVSITFTPVTTTDRRYIYWVRIDTDQSYTTKDVDVVGTIYVSTHSSKNSAKNDPTDEFDLGHHIDQCEHR